MEKKHWDDLAIFTSTLYDNSPIKRTRVPLSIRFFENARDLRIAVFAVDGGSNEEFVGKIKNFENVTVAVQKNTSMGEHRRHALKMAMSSDIASDKEYYLWSEPEKYSLLEPETLDSMIAVLRSGQADIVVPKRKSMDSCSAFQNEMETKANIKAAQIMGSEEVFDLWFGPKMMNRTGARYFLNYKSDVDKWDATIVPVVQALHDGKKIVSVPVDFKYDPIQKSMEEKSAEMDAKRIEQYTSIISEIEKAC